MTKKLAIVISGAVSLGSYEAGVMYEVIEAIARHNEKYQNDDEKRIEIDVITGASAGGMTACMLAQHLLCSDLSLRDAYENPLYKAWVKEVDIRNLLEVEVADHKFSLLQSKVVSEIGAKYIQDAPEVTQNRHPAAASEIQIGIAMSNLNGYEYRLSPPNQQKTGFGYTQYKDQFVCVARRVENEVTLREKTLLESEDQELDVWEEFRDTNWVELREVGLSSGAFPFAFRAREIKRYGGDEEIRGKKNRFFQRSGDYLYVDGGVFENEPIGMAQELVAQLDKTSDYDSPTKRYYLYVAPGERKLPENPLLQKDIDILKTGGSLIGAIFQQARFQKWIIKGIKNPIFSITANDFQLLGDVFSAFAGFLEEKFRAYDYNIGRELTQEALQSKDDALSGLAELLEYDQIAMPAIAWKVSGQISGKDVDSWSQAKKRLEKLAKPIVPDNRSQLEELKNLMGEVDIETRQKILKQVISRYDSLFKLFIDSQKNIKLIKIILLFTRFGLRTSLKIWLMSNVLNLPKKKSWIRYN